MSASLDWNSARDAAAARSYRGVSGHLATVTSAAENGFVTTNFGGTTFWLGAVQAPGSPEPAGGFGWVTGEPFTYTDWNSGEPNNAGVNGEPPSTTPRQDAIQRNNFNKWNDVPTAALASFYLVEYDVIVVDTTIDASTADDGVTSLREAVAFANNNSGNHSIIFDATAFAAPRKTITLNGPAFITGNVSITAPTAGLILSSSLANGNSVIMVRSGVATLSGLTVQGNTTLGIVVTGGTVAVEGCTFAADSNAAFINDGAQATVRNSTFAQNLYGIRTVSGTTSIESCTLTGNGTGLRMEGGVTVNLNNSIVAGNSSNVDGILTSDTNNITNGTAMEAGLSPSGLQENSGPTQTIALVAGSPAINSGATALTTDQRGRPRPFGATADDKGAFEVQNNVPSLSAVTITPNVPKTKDTLTADFTSSDGDVDTLTTSYVWRKNGDVIAGQSGNTLDLATAGNGDKGDSISVTVTVSDGKEAGTVSATSPGVTIQNTAPVVSSVTIDQSVPKTNDTLSFTIGTLTDADGDTLTPTYQWKKNGEDIQGATGATLKLSIAGNGDKGERISVVVTATDGTNSNFSESNQVTIGNTPPKVLSLTLSAWAPLTNDLLTTTVRGSDADGGDTLTYSYVWIKNSDIILGETGPTLDLSKPGNGDDNDIIEVRVTANDGSDNSQSYYGGASFVGNLAPQVLAIRPLNAIDAVGTKRTFTVTMRDPNGADDIREMWLLINTTLDWSAGATLVYRPSANSLSDGQLFLRRGDEFLLPIAIGRGASPSAVLDNGAVRVAAGDVSVMTDAGGEVLTLSIAATIRDGLVGQNSIYARAQDAAGAVDLTAFSDEFGFIRGDYYTVTSQFSRNGVSAPTVSNLNPGVTNTTLNSAGLATAPQNFGFFVKDENGIGDMESVWFLANKTRGWNNSATFVYYPRTRRLVLRSNDGNSFLGGGVIGTPGIIENSQVRVDLSKVKVLIYSDGKSFGLTLPLQAKSGLLGANKVWLRVQDNDGLTSPDGDDLGFVLKGTWNVKASTTTGADAKPSGGNS